VYSLITKIIEEKNSFYAYKDIEDYIFFRLNTRKDSSKTQLLLFKLINYFNCKKIVELGSGYGLNSLYLTAPSEFCECICYESSAVKYETAKKLYKGWNRKISLHTENLPDIVEKQDCIYINLNNFSIKDYFLKKMIHNNIKESSLIIIEDIRTNKSHQVLWRNLKELDEVTVSLDLFNIGILFFDPKLYKRNYRISF